MYKEHENGHLRLYTHYLIHLMYNPFSSYTSAEYDSTLLHLSPFTDVHAGFISNSLHFTGNNHIFYLVSVNICPLEN